MKVTVNVMEVANVAILSQLVRRKSQSQVNSVLLTFEYWVISHMLT